MRVEDATQEILVRVVTHLGSFRGDAALRTWVWRIAANLRSVRRGRREPEGLDFERLEGMLATGLAMPPGTASLPDDVDRWLLEEEVKPGCTQMMLACLDRDHRLAFILGEIFELPGPEAAAILEISPEAYRQRLTRARRRLRSFMTATRGLVSSDAACRCDRQLEPPIAMGLLDPSRPFWPSIPHTPPSTRASFASTGRSSRSLHPRRSCAPIPTTRPRKPSSSGFAR